MRTQETQRGTVERRRLESSLAQAIEAQQQVLYYQPIVALATGRIAAFEALVRWRHPERGLLGPAELIPICESTGLILPLGRWILRRAFRQAFAWQRRFPEHGGLQVSVNLSEKQLIAPDFLADLDGLARETGVQPATMAFELREALLVDAPESMALLWQLRRRGFRIQIDGFGTGYTSLQELYRSPVEALKIDRSFVARIKPGGEDAEVVRAASGLGEGLGLSVVAEGIETKSQLDWARRLGPTHAQGYLFSRPLPSEEAAALIAEDPRW